MIFTPFFCSCWQNFNNPIIKVLNDVKFATNSLVINERITFSVPRAGPILESTYMCAIFQQKGKKGQKLAKYLKIWAKMYKT